MRYALLALALVCCPAAAAPAACLTSKAVAGGELCTIRPSQTDPMIQDAGETAHGFGDHVVALPTDPNGKLWVHFAGSGGTPFLPQSGRYQHEVWLIELLAQGYTVLDLAYDNEESLNERCVDIITPPLNNCAGAARVEVLTGRDTSPVANVSVPNSIVHRVGALVDFMHDNNMSLPDGAYPFSEWSQVSVSGHSQGAGHAYYIAKNYGVQFACLLGGPFDAADPVPFPRPPASRIADWYLDDTNHKTAVNDMGAFLTVQDDGYTHFTFAYGVIGLTKDKHWFEANQRRYTDDRGNPVDGHAAAVRDPSLADLRAKACF